MDAYAATKTVMSRIQSMDPENSSKILCYILMQERGDKEMIRLAMVPETLLFSYINQVKGNLGLLQGGASSTPSTPLSDPISPNNPFPRTSSRVLIPNNEFHLSNPSSPAATFPRGNPRPISYAAVLNGSSAGASNNNTKGSGSTSLHFYGSGEFLSGGGGDGMQDKVQDRLSFVDDSMKDPIISPSGRSDTLLFPYGVDLNSIPSPQRHPFHRRSCSVDDAAFLSNLEEGSAGSGFGWGPCMYFRRGFCKNGSSCKFIHVDFGSGETFGLGSPSKAASGFDELLRMKALRQQKLALMASGGHLPLPYNECMNFLTGNQRNDFSSMGLSPGATSSSRQIYLTFPADSTFKEEDVSNYFSKFGPVQDVRIPYQQKRMFGFVTFVYPETVKLILAKGNPHFVCDSRVLVKPYKEKGKVSDKKQLQLQHQYLERGKYPASFSPSGIDPSELLDLPVGPRMLLNAQETMPRRKLEQELKLQHAIELQGRRIMNLRLMDQKNQQLNNRFLPIQPAGVPVSSQRQSQLLMSQSFIGSSDSTDQVILQEFDDGQEASKSPTTVVDDEQFSLEEIESSTNKNTINASKHQHVKNADTYLPESLEDTQPDSLFASPTKLSAEHKSVLSHASASADDIIPTTNTFSNDTTALLSSSSLCVSSLHYPQ